ncbi:MAG: hypothetical protein MI741_21020, partial [Rhodospirillales bacterium]|nr:hypothetical protein [Rhodospirillales bacterium]
IMDKETIQGVSRMAAAAVYGLKHDGSKWSLRDEIKEHVRREFDVDKGYVDAAVGLECAKLHSKTLDKPVFACAGTNPNSPQDLIADAGGGMPQANSDVIKELADDMAKEFSRGDVYCAAHSLGDVAAKVAGVQALTQSGANSSKLVCNSFGPLGAKPAVDKKFTSEQIRNISSRIDFTNHVIKGDVVPTIQPQLGVTLEYEPPPDLKARWDEYKASVEKTTGLPAQFRDVPELFLSETVQDLAKHTKSIGMRVEFHEVVTWDKLSTAGGTKLTGGRPVSLPHNQNLTSIANSRAMQSLTHLASHVIGGALERQPFNVSNPYYFEDMPKGKRAPKDQKPLSKQPYNLFNPYDFEDMLKGAEALKNLPDKAPLADGALFDPALGAPVSSRKPEIGGALYDPALGAPVSNRNPELDGALYDPALGAPVSNRNPELDGALY